MILFHVKATESFLRQKAKLMCVCFFFVYGVRNVAGNNNNYISRG